MDKFVEAAGPIEVSEDQLPSAFIAQIWSWSKYPIPPVAGKAPHE